MPATVGITLRVPVTRSGLSRAVRYLVSTNRAYLRSHPTTPRLYDSGVRYRREPRGREQWQTIPELLQSRFGDCEDLAAWLIAERLEQGRVAAPHLTKKRGTWHVTVKTAAGVEDPSKRLGM